MDHERSAASAEAAHRPRRSRRGFGLAVALLLPAAFFAGGFVQFATRVAHTRPAPLVAADGIVALTGGTSRIADAVTLLEQGAGERLLISGVHPDTTGEEIARIVTVSPEVFKCCVDLDYGALNTAGNAEAARDWAADHKFDSLLVVTSAYHMPRSLMELSRAAPGIALEPYPVRTGNLDLERWWADPGVMRLMASEYVKYVLARAGIRFGAPKAPSQTIAGAAPQD